MDERRVDPRISWLLGAIVLLGLGLRLASAQGGLWLDEAWSAVLADEVGTPLGIFLSINHDNNHHLNSLWLQLVGLGAEPMLARALSIASGTAAIWVAWKLGARRDTWTGLVAALLFAVSPILVTLGSEARGYAPMALAFLVAILLADRWLAGDEPEPPHRSLALCFLVGALAQLTIVIGFCALAGWIFLSLWRGGPLARAARETTRLLWPSAAVLAAMLALVLGAAAASPAGWRFGAYVPFAWSDFGTALVQLAAFALGPPAAIAAGAALAAILALLALRADSGRANLYRLLLIAFPISVALLQPGNAGHVRYYLIPGLALLFLAAELIARSFGVGGWKRWLAVGALAVIVAASLARDVALIRNQRGDPLAAVRALAARAPSGTRILLERPPGQAILQAAAAHEEYPLEILAAGSCGPAQFLFADYSGRMAPPPTLIRCRARYERIAAARAGGLSDSHWALYELADRSAPYR